MQKSPRILELSTKSWGGGYFFIHPVCIIIIIVVNSCVMCINHETDPTVEEGLITSISNNTT